MTYVAECHRYKTASDLSREIEDALWVVTRRSLDMPGGSQIPAPLVAESYVRLQNILGELSDHLSGRAKHSEYTDAFPPTIVDRLQNEWSLKDGLGQLTAALEDRQPLNQRELGLLDEIADVFDEEASSAFTSIMRG